MPAHLLPSASSAGERVHCHTDPLSVKYDRPERGFADTLSRTVCQLPLLICTAMQKLLFLHAVTGAGVCGCAGNVFCVHCVAICFQVRVSRREQPRAPGDSAAGLNAVALKCIHRGQAGQHGQAGQRHGATHPGLQGAPHAAAGECNSTCADVTNETQRVSTVLLSCSLKATSTSSVDT